MMKMEGQKMQSWLIWDYKFLKVWYYQLETWQCCYMTTGQLNWVDEVWETCKFASSRGSQIIPQLLTLHLPSIETLGYFRASVRKTVTPLRGNKIQVSCHILTHSCSLWNTLHSWPTIQNQIILLIAIIVPTETTYFLFICFFQVQLRNKSREETQSLKAFSPNSSILPDGSL